ncbi:MAG: hypothetical protein ABF991_00305 [Liquorilactobacillus hordei]
MHTQKWLNEHLINLITIELDASLFYDKSENYTIRKTEEEI